MDGIQNEIVVLEINYSILYDDGVVFTDGNASVQCLSDTKRNIGEIVEIVPITFMNNGSRKYRPHGHPLGAGQIFSKIYADRTLLYQLDWPVINGTDFKGSERRRKTCAEVLVPDVLPLSTIQGIAVNSNMMVQKVNNLIIQYNLENQIPFATLKSYLFFPN